MITQNIYLRGSGLAVSSYTVMWASSLSPTNMPKYWTLEKSYLNQKKKRLISWLFLMEPFRLQISVPTKNKSSGPLVPLMKQMGTARPKCLMIGVHPNRHCHWFQCLSIRCKMLLFELCRLQNMHTKLYFGWGLHMEAKTPPRITAGSCNLGPVLHFECRPILSLSFPYTSGHGSPAALFKLALFCNSLIKQENATAVAEGTLSFPALTQSRHMLCLTRWCLLQGQNRLYTYIHT